VERKITVSQLRATFPSYFMSKNKIKLKEGMNVDDLLNQIQKRYSKERISSIDGVKIDFEKAWVHLRKSNTEPIIRVYTEAKSEEKAIALAQQFVTELNSLI
jgi:phosphomannomutase